jgi:hypothetical protein
VFPNLGSSEQQAALIVGFFLPLVLAIPMQPHWPNSIRTIFAVAAYAAAGAIIAAAGGHFTGKSVWQVTLEVLTLGVIGYQGVWKPSGLAPVIENATSTKSLGLAAPAGPPAGANGGGGSGGGSALEPQIAELLTAAVRLLEHTTNRIAALPTSPAPGAVNELASNGGEQPAEKVGTNQHVGGEAEAVKPTEVVDSDEAADRRAANEAADRAAGPPLR